jgi:NADPH:sulfur oxidoreductase
MYYPPEFFRKERGIDVRINAKVIEVGEGFLRVRQMVGKVNTSGTNS